jgi:myo-inositol 2-dehydrogenase / D-chiro-inositol 1-dehydrogenase
MANWFLGGHPLKANGTGGRTDWSGTPNDTGDAWDHFLVNFWYPNGVHASFSSHQLTSTFADLCVRCFGAHGSADLHYAGLAHITPSEKDKAWIGTEKDDTFKGGCVSNIQKFVESIRTAAPVNNAPVAVESNLTAILGRMAAYQERTVTWDEMMASREKWELNLKLKW